MKKSNAHIVPRIIAFLLMWVLLAPTLIQWVHILESHDHRASGELATQVEQCESECQICDFQLASFTYEVHDFPNSVTDLLTARPNQPYATIYPSFSGEIPQGRAPPRFLV